MDLIFQTYCLEGGEVVWGWVEGRDGDREEIGAEVEASLLWWGWKSPAEFDGSSSAEYGFREPLDFQLHISHQHSGYLWKSPSWLISVLHWSRTCIPKVRHQDVAYVWTKVTVNPQIKTGIQLEAGLQIVAGRVVDTDKYRSGPVYKPGVKKKRTGSLFYCSLPASVHQHKADITI